MVRHAVLALILLAYAAAAALSPLPWNARSTPMVAPVAALPQDEIGDLAALLDSGIRLDHAIDPAIPDEGPIALGFSYRQFSIAKLPILAYRELGLALMRDTPTGLTFVPLNDAQLAELSSKTGVEISPRYSFPRWKYMWGWLFAVALMGWYLLQRRSEIARRDALGLI